MSVSETYREFVVESLSRVTPVTAKRMFGGVGLYARGLFFALIDDDTLYFKVDDENRLDFEARGSRPFMPFGAVSHVMQYYEVPADVLEETDVLRDWVEKAVSVARRAASKRAPRTRKKSATKRSAAKGAGAKKASKRDATRKVAPKSARKSARRRRPR